MTTAATSLLGLALPVTGELSGTWGDTVNNSITSLLDTAIAGTTTLSTDGDVTLSTTTLAANQARQAILLCSGARTAIRTITAPAQSKIYTIINATTGGYAVKIVGVGPTTGISIPAGQTATVAWNGSDFVDASNYTNGNKVINGNLSVTGSVTLSGGTANGVAYLNGSKVLTTGSALTFDGTTLVAGASAPFTIGTATLIQAQGTGYAAGRYSVNPSEPVLNYGKSRSGTIGALGGAVVSGDRLGALQFYGDDGTSWVQSAKFWAEVNGTVSTGSVPSNFVWSLSGSEQMRLTSTGLGIGTTSPVTKLQVGTVGSTGASAATNQLFGDYSTAAQLRVMFNNTGNYIGIGTDGGSNLILGTSGANAGTSPTALATLTSSGNLGIGTTSPSVKLQVEGAANSAPVTLLRLNNSGTTSGGPGIASRMTFTAGSTALGYIQGSNFDSGAAGLQFSGDGTNAQATLNSSGNLGLGVTPSAWSTGKAFEIVGAGNAIWAANAINDIRITSNIYYNGGYKYAANGRGNLFNIGSTTGQFEWYTAGNNTSGAGAAATLTQAMTLDASGNLGIGETSPAYALVINRNTAGQIINLIGSGGSGKSMGLGADATGGYIQQNGANPFYFYINGAERARIDSSGNLLVGTTSNTNNRRFITSSGINTYAPNRMESTAASGDMGGLYIVFTAQSPNNTTSQFIGCDDSTATRFYVRSNGGIGNYQANNVNLSDRREKTNFAPAGEYLSKICAIPVQTFNYIDQSEDDPGLTLGVVAQDVQAVAPELVMESDWSKEGEEPKMRLSIYQTDLQYALMKCIQEQQALIQTLTERITALESK